MFLEELTKAQLEEKVANGEYIKEELFFSNTIEESGTLNKSIFKYNYFTINHETNSLQSEISSSAYIRIPTTGLILSNTTMRIKFNDIIKDIYISEDQGNFSGISYVEVPLRVEEFLTNLFYEAFDNTYKIEVNISSMSNGRLIKIRIRSHIDYVELPATITVYNGEGNSLLDILKWTDGQTCTNDVIVKEQVYTKNYAGRAPVNNSLCDGAIVFSTDTQFYTDETKKYAGSDTSIYVYSIYGYRPVRKKIYIYKSDDTIYLHDHSGQSLYDKDSNQLTAK
jgi:hypothetical protein